jgi:hypothetical protein
MSKLGWAIVAAGILSAWLYKESKGPSFKGFFAGEEEEV